MNPNPQTLLSTKRAWLAAWLCLGALWMLPSGCHLLRAQRRDAPLLSTGIHAGVLAVQARERKYLLYVPAKRQLKPPLLILLHASRQTSDGLRRTTGYAFDRLADRHGFVVVYPDGYRRRWNDCRASGRYASRRLGIDDVAYLSALTDELTSHAGIDPTRVFLAGYSAGGQLAFRAGFERPDKFAAIAAFSANLPADENWGCRVPQVPVSAMLINGTEDRINPYEGGEVTVFGFASRGVVRSARASAEYLAKLAGVTTAEERRIGEANETAVDQSRWYAPGSAEVVLLSVHGGGHVVPGPHSTFPRILGNVSTAIDGPQEVWNFFARQPARAQFSAQNSEANRCVSARE